MKRRAEGQGRKTTVNAKGGPSCKGRRGWGVRSQRNKYNGYGRHDLDGGGATKGEDEKIQLE